MITVYQDSPGWMPSFFLSFVSSFVLQSFGLSVRSLDGWRGNNHDMSKGRKQASIVGDAAAIDRRLRVAIMPSRRGPRFPQAAVGRTITIMSTRNPCNSFEYSMIQKRDFGTRVIDIICQESSAVVPLTAEKGGSNPFCVQKAGIKSHF